MDSIQWMAPSPEARQGTWPRCAIHHIRMAPRIQATIRTLSSILPLIASETSWQFFPGGIWIVRVYNREPGAQYILTVPSEGKPRFSESPLVFVVRVAGKPWSRLELAGYWGRAQHYWDTWTPKKCSTLFGVGGASTGSALRDSNIKNSFPLVPLVNVPFLIDKEVDLWHGLQATSIKQ